MKILVPTDFSENAKNALEFAENIAKFSEGSLTLVFAYYSAYNLAAQSAAIVSKIEESAHKAMEELKSGPNQGLNVDHKIVQGSVATAITSMSYQEDYDLIIMGTQGASGILKTLVGSNTVHVIKDSQVPVLVVPAKSAFEMVQEITVAVEWNESEGDFFHLLFQLTQPWNLPYRTLHIKHSKDDKPEKSSNKLEESLKKNYPHMTHSTVVANGIIEGIDIYLKKNPGSLLVMFSRDKPFLEYLFNLGNVEKMAYHTHVPLLVLKG